MLTQPIQLFYDSFSFTHLLVFSWFPPSLGLLATQFVVGGADTWIPVSWIPKPRLFISTRVVFHNHTDLWRLRQVIRKDGLFRCELIPFLCCWFLSSKARASGFSTRRGPNTKVVYVILDSESSLQMMAFGPLLLPLIMSNLYISHRSCRLIYWGGGLGSKNLLVFFFCSASEIIDLDVSMRQH